MNAKVLETVVGQLGVIIETNNFKPNDDGTVYKNEKIAFRISHNEEKKLLLLDVAEVTENGETGDFKNASSWLFEDEESVRDAESAGLDFLDTLKGKMGIRSARTTRGGEVALPRKDTGSAVNIEALSAKCLAVFPQFKEMYKEHVSLYGSLLYVEFFKSTVAVKMGEVLDENNKKTVKKVISMLDDMYVKGDRNVQNVVAGIILGGACRENEKRYETALSYMDETPYLKNAFKNIMAKVNKDKRFKAIFS